MAEIDDFDFEGLGDKLTNTIISSFGEATNKIKFNTLSTSLEAAFDKVNMSKVIEKNLTNNDKVKTSLNAIQKKLEDGFKNIKFQVGDITIPQIPQQVVKIVADTSNYELPAMPKSTSITVQVDTALAQKQIDTFSLSQEPITMVTEAAQMESPVMDTSSFEQAGDLVRDFVNLTQEANKKSKVTVELYSKIVSIAEKLVSTKRMEKAAVDEVMAALHKKMDIQPAELSAKVVNVDTSKVKNVQESTIEVGADVKTTSIDTTSLEKAMSTFLINLKKNLSDVFSRIDFSGVEKATDRIFSRKPAKLVDIGESLQEIQSLNDETKQLELARRVLARGSESEYRYAQKRVDLTEQLRKTSNDEIAQLAEKLNVQNRQSLSQMQLRTAIKNGIIELYKEKDIREELISATEAVTSSYNRFDTSKVVADLSLELGLTEDIVAEKAQALMQQNELTNGIATLTDEQKRSLKLDNDLLQISKEQADAASELVAVRNQINDTIKSVDLSIQTQEISNQLGLMSEEAKMQAAAIIQRKLVNGEAAELSAVEAQRLTLLDAQFTKLKKVESAAVSIGESQKELNNLVDQMSLSETTIQLSLQNDLTEESVVTKAKALLLDKQARGEVVELSAAEAYVLQLENDVVKAKRESLEMSTRLQNATAEMSKQLRDNETELSVITDSLLSELDLTQEVSAEKAKAIILDGRKGRLTKQEVADKLKTVSIEDKLLKTQQLRITATKKLEEATRAVTTAIEESGTLASILESTSFRQLNLTQEISKARAQAIIQEGQINGLTQQEINKKLAIVAAEDKILEQNERRKKISNDLTSATDDLKNAMEQTKADIQVKQLIVSLQLTESETAQLARQLALDNQRRAAAGELTGEQIKQLQLNNGLLDVDVQRLKHENQHLRHGRETVEIYEHIAEYQKEINEELEQFSMGWKKTKATISAIMQDPAFAKGVFMASALEGMHRLTHSMHEFMDVGMTAGEGVRATLDSLSIKSIMGLSKNKEVLTTLVQEYGNMNALSKEQRNTVGEMASAYGLSGDEATKLTMAVSRMSGQSKDTAINFKKTAESVAKAKGVMPSQIMKEMAKNTEKMALYSKGGAEGFAKAAAEAKKMGVELDDMLSAAEKTLEFEQSLTDQMELSAMTGKEVNLDRLRGLVMANDAAGVLEEQKRLIQAMGGLDNMDYLTKKKAQETLGITVENMKKIEESTKNQTDQVEEQNKTWVAITDAAGGLMKYGEGTFKAFTAIAPLITGMASLMQIMNVTSMKGLMTSTWSMVRGLAAGVVQAGILLAKMIAIGATKLFGSKEQLQQVRNFFGKEGAAGKLTERIRGGGPSFADRRKMVLERQRAGGGLSPATPPPTRTPGGAGSTDQASKVGKLKTGDMIKGAAALLIVAAALYVAAKAFQEFAQVKWEDVAKGLVGITGLALVTKILASASSSMIKGAIAVAILGAALIPFAYAMSLIAGLDISSVLAAAAGLVIFSAAVFGLGALMMTGVGAAVFGAGLLALAGLGLALIVLGEGLQSVASPMQTFTQSIGELLKSVNPDDLLKVGIGLGALALGMIGLGAGVVYAIPAAASIGILGAALMFLGVAVEKVANNTSIIVKSLTDLSKLDSDVFTKIGDGLLHIAKGLGAIGLSGIAAIPALAALSKLGLVPQASPATPAAPSATTKTEAKAVPPPPTAIPAPAPGPIVQTTTTQQPASTPVKNDQLEAQMKSVIDKFEQLITVFRKKDITLLLDSKVLHKELFDNNYGGKTGTNRV